MIMEKVTERQKMCLEWIILWCDWRIDMEEKINRLRELIKEIDSYNDAIFMYEIDKINLKMLKDEVFEILRTL